MSGQALPSKAALGHRAALALAVLILAAAVAGFAFIHLRANRVEIRCDTRNLASARVASRAGFALEATLHHDCRDTAGTARAASRGAG